MSSRGTTTPAANRWNPNPKNWVGGGSRSIDEMSFAWVTITYLEEDDFQERVAARRRAQARRTTSSPRCVQESVMRKAVIAGAVSCCWRVRCSSSARSSLLDRRARCQQLPTEVAAIRFNSGQSVVPYFEGWIPNPDGTFDMVFGYFNRNFKRGVRRFRLARTTRLSPAPSTAGQPTYFLARRQRYVFRVRVPEGFR